MKDKLISELLELTNDWTMENGVSKSDQLRIREIGQSLHDMGGIHLMEDVFYTLHSYNPFVGAIRGYWHKIGEWRF